MKRKIAVYAICKNEAAFCERWIRSMREADEIVVLDTGSEDASAEILRMLGAKVFEKKIVPWRFDEARNEALSHVPDDVDICVAADLDEVFSPGWRRALEKKWAENTTRARFKYVWSFRPDGSEGTVLYLDKIHGRTGYRWYYPVHEALIRTDGKADAPDNYITLDSVQLNHYPDNKKSRAQYLDLLELSFKENPFDPRAAHYLGREYMYLGMWEQAIKVLFKHVSMPASVWKEEKCASYRYMGRCYMNLMDYESAENAFLNAVLTAPHLREGYYELANLLYLKKEYAGCAHYCLKALEIIDRPTEYISEDAAWNGNIENLLNEAKRACLLSFR